jgi:hypothetical protein
VVDAKLLASRFGIAPGIFLNDEHLKQRFTYTCRECQVADWKAGFPSPHKLICGQDLDGIREAAATVTQPAAKKPPKEDGDPFPDPLPSFKRPPALLHQISLLRDSSHVDYVVCFILIPLFLTQRNNCPKLCNPYPQDDHGVIVAHPMGMLSPEYPICV